MKRRSPPNPPDESLPPHSDAAEAGVLGCILLEPGRMNDCKNIRPEHFYDLRHAMTWKLFKTMTTAKVAIDTVTVGARLAKDKQLEAQTGGLEYVSGLPDKVPSAANLPYYLGILLEKFALRKTAEVCRHTLARVEAEAEDVESLMMGLRADIETVTALKMPDSKPALRVWRCSELAAWQVPEHLRLVGDNEINTGYDGIALIAGPGSVGKSLVSASLALAGAIGSGLWMGRKVHRKFKTLIIQAENGPVRLKSQVAAMAKAHPDVDIEESIFFTEPPEGGLPFHRPEFRAAVRAEIERIKPSLVVLDSWMQVAAEDGSKEIIEKLVEVRSCFPAGDECPGLLIIAHTKKPRPEDVRRGRGLANLVSGSISLVNTCRTVYLVLPWLEDLEDDRVYWSCPKLNNGAMYSPSVWHRRYGGFFDHDPETDPTDWGKQDAGEASAARAIEAADVIDAFGNLSVLSKTALARRLEEKLDVAYPTAMRALSPGPGGYLSHLVELTVEGWLKLKPQPGKEPKQKAAKPAKAAKAA